ncbi:dihydropteridine reductase [Salinicoccus sp. HZC-1]|uniref:dihydropteridine reductase n=1 Tax=Salinicoccus sp. HZC-1 TaxID=3385497 RepID=UPI00398B6B20
MKIYWTKISDIIEESPDTKTYLIDCPEEYTWEEGAHIHLGLEGFNAGDKPDKSLVRHMSISTLPDEDKIGITTRIREQRSDFKHRLDELTAGSPVAIFKTHSNVPLKREDKPVYLLSSGVGIATFRPLVLDYLSNPDKIEKIHSLNIDSTKNYLFKDIFETLPEKGLTSQFVDNRKHYYEEVQKLAQDEEGLFYVVGSDAFLLENLAVLRGQGVSPEQIMLDKHEHRKQEFFL